MEHRGLVDQPFRLKHRVFTTLYQVKMSLKCLKHALMVPLKVQALCVPNLTQQALGVVKSCPLERLGKSQKLTIFRCIARQCREARG